MKFKWKWIKPALLHLLGVGAVAAIFVWLSDRSVVTENTEVPWAIDKAISLYISLNGFYLGFLIATILIIAHKLANPTDKIRKYIRKGFYLVLALVTGKFYGFSAFLFAMVYLSSNVDYFPEVKGGILYGALSFVLGIIFWFYGREMAVNVWAKANKQSQSDA